MVVLCLYLLGRMWAEGSEDEGMGMELGYNKGEGDGRGEERLMRFPDEADLILSGWTKGNGGKRRKTKEQLFTPKPIQTSPPSET